MESTLDDPFGRTPEEATADRERARQVKARVAGRDWHEVPKGYYAVPVRDFGSAEWEANDWAGQPPIMAYRLFERRVVRHCKNGRDIGKDRFIIGAVMLASDDVDPERVRCDIANDREMGVQFYGPKGDLKMTVDEIMLDLEAGDTFRPLFGQLTGRCGCCGKGLSDPKSKLLGIGPDCRGYR